MFEFHNIILTLEHNYMFSLIHVHNLNITDLLDRIILETLMCRNHSVYVGSTCIMWGPHFIEAPAHLKLVHISVQTSIPIGLLFQIFSAHMACALDDLQTNKGSTKRHGWASLTSKITKSWVRCPLILVWEHHISIVNKESQIQISKNRNRMKLRASRFEV